MALKEAILVPKENRFKIISKAGFEENFSEEIENNC